MAPDESKNKALDWLFNDSPDIAFIKRKAREMGKGDTPRPVNKEKFDEGFERVFGKREPKVWEDAPDCSEGDPSDDRPSGGVEQEPRGQLDPQVGETVAGTRHVLCLCKNPECEGDCGL